MSRGPDTHRGRTANRRESEDAIGADPRSLAVDPARCIHGNDETEPRMKHG